MKRTDGQCFTSSAGTPLKIKFIHAVLLESRGSLCSNCLLQQPGTGQYFVSLGSGLSSRGRHLCYLSMRVMRESVGGAKPAVLK